MCKSFALIFNRLRKDEVSVLVVQGEAVQRDFVARHFVASVPQSLGNARVLFGGEGSVSALVVASGVGCDHVSGAVAAAVSVRDYMLNGRVVGPLGAFPAQAHLPATQGAFSALSVEQGTDGRRLDGGVIHWLASFSRA